MDTRNEIEQLLAAYQASTDNSILRDMLIDKMSLLQEYDQPLEKLLHQSLKERPGNMKHKSHLVDLYYRMDKKSACIVIAEEVGNLNQLNLSAVYNIIRCYLDEDNYSKAQQLYMSSHDRSDFESNPELDGIFKMDMQQLPDESDDLILEKPRTNFSHVGGMEGVKREIDLKIIKPLENQELYAKYGKKVGGGILLYGPPGCGKTFIAKATAGEIDANFINVSLNDILDMWVGSSERNLNSYFELARSKTPCVLFFDEVDALGAKRSDLRQSAGKNVINQFLAEMDGLHAENEGILIIGATNSPWHLDSAFRRPGRFDRIIFVPPPDDVSKESIIKLKLQDKPHKNIDFKKLSKLTKNYSGADINAIIDIAIESIIEKALMTGEEKPIETADLTSAIKKHKASTVDWFTTAKNYALFSNKSGLYDEVLKYLK